MEKDDFLSLVDELRSRGAVYVRCGDLEAHFATAETQVADWTFEKLAVEDAEARKAQWARDNYMSSIGRR